MSARGRIDRRRFLVAGGICVAGVGCVGSRIFAAEAAGSTGLAAIEAELGGRVGVMARDTGSGAELAWRADERFALCSTFKWILAAMILSETDRGDLTLDRRIEYGEADLLDYAPVTREHAAAGSMTVAGLCRAAVVVSDNTAANLLLELIGGPARLTAFLRQNGDTVTRLDRYEPALNTNIPGDQRDTTTPRAMLDTMQHLLLGDALSPASRERLNGWLVETATGRARLRAGLPDGWTVGDKTGTGKNGAANDVAIAWPPGRPPILVASYLSGSDAAGITLNAAHTRVARTVAQAL